MAETQQGKGAVEVGEMYELATFKPNFSKLLHINQVISIASLTKA